MTEGDSLRKHSTNGDRSQIYTHNMEFTAELLNLYIIREPKESLSLSLSLSHTHTHTHTHTHIYIERVDNDDLCFMANVVHIVG